MKEISLNQNYQKMVRKSIYAIVLFIITYVVLICSALALLIGCFYAGAAIIMAKVMWATIIIGLGLIAMSIFVFVSLISFMFKRSKVDLSGYLEVLEKTNLACLPSSMR